MKLTEWLAEDDKLKGAEIFTALLTLAAGIVWVYLDGFTGETIAQVTATLGTASVIIITFVDKMKRQEVTDFVTAGSKALVKLQNEYPAILSGPKYSKRNKEDFAIEETTTDERKYLFFKRGKRTGGSIHSGHPLQAGHRRCIPGELGFKGINRTRWHS